ncbi:MAG: Stp1/IreP family PP2C-type Ser/Thr phosphatase [Eubacterium sp.]
MKCAYSSNIGAKRRVNQDAYLAAAIENKGRKYYVFAVADGLGGHRSGEVASQMTVDYIKDNLSDVENYFDYDEMNGFVNAINKEIINQSKENPDCLGMATTLTMCILDGCRLGIVHVGDSRAYRINEAGIVQLTKDHSLVQVLVDEGKITSKEASVHPQKNVITRALGTDDTVQIDLYDYPVSAEDILLICSDGLYNMVDEETIRMLVLDESLEDATKELINLANRNGGNDNITVILFNPKEEVTAND